MDNARSGFFVLLFGDHQVWKVEREARMDPPIQTEIFSQEERQYSSSIHSESCREPSSPSLFELLNLVNHIVLGLSGKLLSICEPIHTSKMGQYLKDIIIIIVTIVISTGCWLLHHHSDKSKTFYEDDNLPHSFVLRIKYQLCVKIYNSLTKYDEYCAWNPAGQVGKFSWELYNELVLYSAISSSTIIF